MAIILDRLRDDPGTGWDWLNGIVDGVTLHAISFLRPNGFHEGSIVGDGASYPLSLPRSVVELIESKLSTLWRELRSAD